MVAEIEAEDGAAAEEARWFKPAFLGRVILVPHLPLPPDVTARIAAIRLARVAARLREAHGAVLDWDEALPAQVAAMSKDPSVGARGIETVLSQGPLPELSAAILQRPAAGGAVTRARVAKAAAAEGGFAIALE